MNSFCLILLRCQIFQFILNYLILCLKHIHDNANVVYASMVSDSQHSHTQVFIFLFFIKHTPYTISTNYSAAKLATCAIFAKECKNLFTNTL